MVHVGFVQAQSEGRGREQGGIIVQAGGRHPSGATCQARLGEINILKMVGKKSERGLQDVGLMETVEIRVERADSHRSHKPGENARRGAVERGCRRHT